MNYIPIQPLSETCICSSDLSLPVWTKPGSLISLRLARRNTHFSPSVLRKSPPPFINHHGSPSPPCLLHRHLPGAAPSWVFSVFCSSHPLILSNSNYNPHSSSLRIPKNSPNQTPFPHNCTFLPSLHLQCSSWPRGTTHRELNYCDRIRQAYLSSERQSWNDCKWASLLPVTKK